MRLIIESTQKPLQRAMVEVEHDDVDILEMRDLIRQVLLAWSFQPESVDMLFGLAQEEPGYDEIKTIDSGDGPNTCGCGGDHPTIRTGAGIRFGDGWDTWRCE